MLNEKDFIEIEYTGILKKNDVIFDTTNESIAKNSTIFNPRMKYGPLIICIGEGHVIKGLDKNILSMEVGKENEFELKSEEAFGKKDPKLIMLIPESKFKKENLRPVPGMQINVDNQIAVIRSVTGGRVLADFNHPLAGQDVKYKVKINRIVNDPKEKIQAELTMILNREIPVTVEGNKAIIPLPIPEEIAKPIKDKILSLIPEIKEIEFKKDSEKKNIEENNKSN